MEKVEFYPLGSIIRLKDGDQKVFITSRGIVVGRDDKEVFFDYAGVLHPIGLLGDEIAYFNHDMIEELIFEGYSDEEDKLVVDSINKFIDEHPDMERGSLNTFENNDEIIDELGGIKNE